MILQLDCAEGCQPTYATEFAVGADLYARETCYIRPGCIVKVPTGVRIAAAQPDLDIQIRARSGLGSSGILFILGVGTIDPDYRGEFVVPLMNMQVDDYVINKGDRVAQLVVGKAERIEGLRVGGARVGGLGSTGK